MVDAFTSFDKDGSGTLTVNELIKAFKSLGTFADLTRKEVEAFVNSETGITQVHKNWTSCSRSWAATMRIIRAQTQAHPRPH